MGSPSPGKVCPFLTWVAGFRLAPFSSKTSSPLGGLGPGKFKEGLSTDSQGQRPRGPRATSSLPRKARSPQRRHSGVLQAQPWLPRPAVEPAEDAPIPRGPEKAPFLPRPLGASPRFPAPSKPPALGPREPQGPRRGCSINTPTSLLSTFCVPGGLSRGSFRHLPPRRWPRGPWWGRDTRALCSGRVILGAAGPWRLGGLEG